MPNSKRHSKQHGRPQHASKASQKKRRMRKRRQAKQELQAANNHSGHHSSAMSTSHFAEQMPFLSVPLNDWRQQGEKKHFWIVSAIVFITYLFTMPHTVTLEDSGLFNMVCYYAGVGHPPGYPLYTLLCVPFAHLPWLSTAHGVNIFSALCGALACGFMYRSCQLLLHNRLAAYAGGITCGLSSVFWSQAIIQEVYAPNALLVIATMWLCLLYFHSREPRHFYTLALVYGLSLSNHWPLVGLSSFMFLLIVIPLWRDILRIILGRGLFISAAMLALGLLPYLYVIWRSSHDPYINFYDPLDSWERVVHFISRSGYSGVDNAGGTFDDKIEYFFWIAEQMVTEYHWITTIFIGIGFFWQWFRTRWNVSLGVIAGIVGSSFLLTLLLHFTYNELWRSVFRVYPVVPYALLSIWLAFGVDAAIQLLRRLHKKVALFAGAVLAAATIASTGYANIQENYRTNDRWGWLYGSAILKSLEPNAILITWGDLHLSIMYAGTVEKIRPDVDIYNGQALIFNNRPTPALTTREAKNKAWRKMVANTKRPVYFFEGMGEMPWGVEDFGLVKKIRRDLPKGKTVYTMHPEIIKIIPEMLNFHEPDAWTRRHKQAMAKTLTHVLARTGMQADIERGAWAQISQSYAGIMAVAYLVLGYPDINIETEKLIAMLESARTKIDLTTLPPHEQASYYSTLGTALSRVPERVQEALEYLKKGLAAYPSPDNATLPVLMQFHINLNDLESFAKLDLEYPHIIERRSDLQELLKKKNWSWARQKLF